MSVRTKQYLPSIGNAAWNAFSAPFSLLSILLKLGQGVLSTRLAKSTENYDFIKIERRGNEAEKALFSLIGDWLLVFFQISCHFYFSFIRLYQQAHSEILKVKMKIYKSSFLLKLIHIVLDLEDNLISKELCNAKKEIIYAAALNQLEDLCQQITFLMVILLNL